MANNKKREALKVLSFVALATTVISVTDAHSSSEREMTVNAMGERVPVAVKPSFFERMTTYHEEMKPTYDPNSQRIKRPTISPTFDGNNNNTHTPTVKPAWYDRATTYHEEQKRPWNPYSTNDTKKMPAQLYYDKGEAKSWNDHYRQEGLRPVPYMYGSASLVLRKDRKVEETLRENKNLDNIDIVNEKADSRLVPMDNVYIRPADSTGNMEYRNRMNQIANNRSGVVMIGEPKEMDVQAVTKIDEPKVDWRSKLNVKPEMTREGDFDYNKQQEDKVQAYNNGNVNYDSYNQPNQYEEYTGDGQVIANTGAPVANNGYDQYVNNSAKVNNYNVENGDTLSEISDKEKIYGDWTLWPLIYDANRNQIKDPDLIQPGQNLDIPRDYGQEQEYDARYRAKNRDLPISLYDNK